MNIFQRAHQKLPLSPEERAALKFIYMTAGSAALTGLAAAAQYIAANGHSMNWNTVITVFVSTFGLTLFETGRKWVTANSDGPMGAVQQLISAAIQKAATTPVAPKEPAK